MPIDVETVHLSDRPNDLYFVCTPDIRQFIYGHKGGDRIFLSGNSDLGVYAYGGEGRDYLSAADLAEYVYSHLEGGEGLDTVVGGKGTDYFYVNRTDDVVIDVRRGDEDLVASSAFFYELPQNVENLRVGGFLSDEHCNGRGNELNNRIQGSSGSNLLEGMAGRDLLIGYGGSDTLVGGLGSDRLYAEGSSTPPVLDYNRTQESCTRLGIDEVLKINRRGDNYVIDLSDIDADISTRGTNDVFTFIGEAAFGADATGQVRFVDEPDRIAILVSTDADSDAEMVIHLRLAVSPRIDNFVL
jgi:Ca2+-binding RTX toxin-like protein